MDTVSEGTPFSRAAREEDDGRYAGGNVILWIAAIAVLIGLNFASWSFCMWVFGQPEHPMNYRLLTKLEKLDPIAGVSPVSAPRGKFYSAKDLYAQVYPFNKTQLAAYNGILKRYYLKNYLERSDVTYLSGEFRVISVQKMGEDDVYTSGLVIRGQSTTFPDAILDLALPTEEVPEKFALAPGQIIRVEESAMCAAVLNVDRLQDSTMIFTAVPLISKTSGANPVPMEHHFAEGAVIKISPPEHIQIEPERWPISRDEEDVEVKPVSLSETPAEEAEAEGEEKPAE
ncbi:hypothetical protein VSU19_21050 [Verrucomicrobiales bacterium BCK34]|nr:hypothetical protein [Verrucomicrobiales bacterium BCK34]